MPDTPLAFWRQLPEPVRRVLARGSTGREQLTGLAGGVLPLVAKAAPADRPRLMALVRHLLLACWSESPLDGGLARLLGAQPLPGSPAPGEPPAGPLDDVLKALAIFWQPPDEGDPWWGLAGHAARREALDARLRAAPKNLFWKAEAWTSAWQWADWDLADQALAPESWPRTLAPVRQLAQAQACLCRDDPDGTLAALDALAPLLPRTCPGLRAEALLRLGRAEEAADVLRRAILAEPWRTSQLLRLTDLLDGTAEAIAPVPGGVAVLLYTWNKARELDETLASLSESELGDARLWVLDNGSTDGTPEILSAWAGRLGDRFTSLRLPVNVGAPAARNWLLSLPEVRGHDFLAFLDDDVSLPADWLLRLGAAVRRFPEASVWGCRVVDDVNPLVLQSIDYTPLAPRPQRDASQILALPAGHLGHPDLGQYRYQRTCVSVTGCCHLLRAAHIDRTGGFDIRFSPSQYDDLERDLRVFIGGGQVVYQGHLAVRHKRRSGALAEQSPAEIGSAQANVRKLEAKHGEAALAALSAAGEAVLVRDLELRLAQFETLLPGI